MHRLSLHVGLACLGALACSPLGGGRSRSEAAPRSPAPASLRSVPTPRLEFLRLETDDRGFRYAVFRFENRLHRPLSYTGYVWDDGAPKLWLERWSATDRAWADRCCKTCGNGMLTYELQPRDHIETRISIGSQDKRPFRVGVYYWVTEYTTDNPITWSELVVPPDEWPPKPPFGSPPRIGL